MRVLGIDRNRRVPNQFRITLNERVTDSSLWELGMVSGVESVSHYVFEGDSRADRRAIIWVVDDWQHLTERAMMSKINAELEAQENMARGGSGIAYTRVPYYADRVHFSIRTPETLLITDAMIYRLQQRPEIEAATRHDDHSASVRGYPRTTETDLKRTIEEELGS